MAVLVWDIEDAQRQGNCCHETVLGNESHGMSKTFRSPGSRRLPTETAVETDSRSTHVGSDSISLPRSRPWPLFSAFLCYSAVQANC